MRNRLICAARGCDGCSVCQPRTDWYPPNIDPVRVGRYEMINTSTGLIFPVFFNGSRWFHDRKGPVVALVRLWPWRGLQFKWWVTGCKANRDGECNWLDCPQLKDGEPMNSGRHCPLDCGDDE